MTADLPSPISHLPLEPLPPSDVVPGIAPIIADRRDILRKIQALQSKLDDEKPFVVRIGVAFYLYQRDWIVVQTQTAQMMIDYLAATFPAGVKIRWFVLPVQQPLQAA